MIHAVVKSMNVIRAQLLIPKGQRGLWVLTFMKLLQAGWWWKRGSVDTTHQRVKQPVIHEASAGHRSSLLFITSTCSSGRHSSTVMSPDACLLSEPQGFLSSAECCACVCLQTVISSVSSLNWPPRRLHLTIPMVESLRLSALLLSSFLFTCSTSHVSTSGLQTKLHPQGQSEKERNTEPVEKGHWRNFLLLFKILFDIGAIYIYVCVCMCVCTYVDMYISKKNIFPSLYFFFQTRPEEASYYSHLYFPRLPTPH